MLKKLSFFTAVLFDESTSSTSIESLLLLTSNNPSVLLLLSIDWPCELLLWLLDDCDLVVEDCLVELFWLELDEYEDEDDFFVVFGVLEEYEDEWLDELDDISSGYSLPWPGWATEKPIMLEINIIKTIEKSKIFLIFIIITKKRSGKRSNHLFFFTSHITITSYYTY